MSENLSVLNNENPGMPVPQAMIQEAMMAAMTQCLAPIMMQLGESVRAMQETLVSIQKDAARRTPLTSAQKGHLSAAIRERAQSVVKKYSLPQAAYNEIMREIRKKLYRRWGVKGIGDIPAGEYQSAIETVDNWDASDIVEKYI